MMASEPTKYSKLAQSLAVLPMISQMVAMLGMASFGRPDLPTHSPDWTLHLVAYFILTQFTWLAWKIVKQEYCFTTKRFAVILSTVTFAVADEGIQYFSPSRAAQFNDLCMDILGIIIAIAVITFFDTRYRTSRKEPFNE